MYTHTYLQLMCSFLCNFLSQLYVLFLYKLQASKNLDLSLLRLSNTFFKYKLYKPGICLGQDKKDIY